MLGVANVHPVDLAAAYATFAAQGVRADWYTVAQVRAPAGEVLMEGKGPTRRVFDQDSMADLTYALSQVVENGSGATAQGIDRPAAGKTGTTNNNRSAWFAGYVPQLSTAVALWDGDQDPSLSGVGGRSRITGGSFPTSIWTAFMRPALEDLDLPEKDFPDRARVGRKVQSAPVAVTPTPTPSATPTPTRPRPPSRRPPPPASPTAVRPATPAAAAGRPAGRGGLRAAVPVGFARCVRRSPAPLGAVVGPSREDPVVGAASEVVGRSGRAPVPARPRRLLDASARPARPDICRRCCWPC